MTLPSGTRLGPYEVLAPLGAGGMGEVYRGRDTRLDRAVAIKVLAPHLSESRELRERFEREARAISSLSHPHICTLYDVGQHDGLAYLVMEHLQGETLADRLHKGPLALEQGLRCAIEIADALDKAHRHGVVHRDLKPGNVMLTRSGAKLLDFGLAKLQPAVGAPASALSGLETREKPLTGQGTILGTFQYMAPEQLEGREADARTDIFAFGVLLYEMVTGRRAFEGKSPASLIGAILHHEPPPMSTLQPMAPAALDRVVRACLAKEPDERWQSAGDVAKELRWIAEGSQDPVAAPHVARRRERVAWSAFAVAAVAALVCAALLARQGRQPSPVFQSSILPPENTRFSFSDSPMALSPDGRQVAFVALSAEGVRRLWVRPFDASAAQPLAGTEGAHSPFWSPDGRFLAFFAGGKLKKIAASGGAPQTICDARGRRGGAWNRDGVILFVPSVGAPIHRVSASGGTASPVTELDAGRGETDHAWPFFLPDGRHFLYVSYLGRVAEDQERSAVYVGSLDSKDQTLLLHARSKAAYAPSSAGSSQGHLLFWRDGAIVARPFDAERLQFTGEAFPVAEQAEFFGASGSATFSVSENGVLAYRSSARGELSRLLWFDRAGKELDSVGEAADYYHPRLSHDGRRVAVVVIDSQTHNSDIWVYDLPRRVSTRLTFGPAVNIFPIWSPDDRWVVFASNRKGLHDLYRKAASGTGEDELLLASETSYKFPSDWSREGGLIAFFGRDTKAQTGSDIWVSSLADRKVTPFLSTPFGEASPQFSPDGRWIAYDSNESGRLEVYVQAFPASSGKWQISSAGGSFPRWRRDGKELFYLAPDKTLMAVEVTAGSGFAAGVPKSLFPTRIKSLDLGFQYDVSADGERFLVNTVVEDEKGDAITVVQNWLEASKK